MATYKQLAIGITIGTFYRFMKEKHITFDDLVTILPDCGIDLELLKLQVRMLDLAIHEITLPNWREDDAD